MKQGLAVFIFTFGLMSSALAASELRTILISSAYGAGAGALVGVTALAFSDNPGQNLNMVARGASLGLYAGLAYGIYMAAQPAGDSSAQVPSKNIFPVVLLNEKELVPAFAYQVSF